jgi:protein-disulfide isomerase
VIVDFPLESIHNQAFKAAEVAHCAGEQGKYWEMHDRLFENQKSFEPWTAHAEALGLKLPQFENCLNSGTYVKDIRKDQAQGQSAGITGTPAFFLALTNPNSTKVRTLRSLKGAQPYPMIKAQIDALLAEPGTGPRTGP